MRQPLPQASQPIWQALGMSPSSTPSSISTWRELSTLAGQEHALADEVGDEAVGGTVVEVVGAVPLLDAALVHHADLVGHGEGLVLVVRHQHRGGAARLDDVAHLERQALAQVDVEVGERLVEQQQLGARRERARERHALLLAAGELVRVLRRGRR